MAENVPSQIDLASQGDEWLFPSFLGNMQQQIAKKEGQEMCEFTDEECLLAVPWDIVAAQLVDLWGVAACKFCGSWNTKLGWGDVQWMTW
jgi:hypothetical protein